VLTTAPTIWLCYDHLRGAGAGGRLEGTSLTPAPALVGMPGEWALGCEGLKCESHWLFSPLSSLPAAHSPASQATLISRMALNRAGPWKTASKFLGR
jgi:hypothetical protein